jgi:hypothetical protein
MFCGLTEQYPTPKMLTQHAYIRLQRIKMAALSRLAKAASSHLMLSVLNIDPN